MIASVNDIELDPEDLANRIAKIQARWTASIRAQRLVGPGRIRWQLPAYYTSLVPQQPGASALRSNVRTKVYRPTASPTDLRRANATSAAVTEPTS